MCVDFSRMLHTNPSSSLTTHKGHVELLQELSGFLEIILKEQGHVEEQVPLTMWQVEKLIKVQITTIITTKKESKYIFNLLQTYLTSLI